MEKAFRVWSKFNKKALLSSWVDNKTIPNVRTQVTRLNDLKQMWDRGETSYTPKIEKESWYGLPQEKFVLLFSQKKFRSNGIKIQTKTSKVKKQTLLSKQWREWKIVNKKVRKKRLPQWNNNERVEPRLFMDKHQDWKRINFFFWITFPLKRKYCPTTFYGEKLRF